MELLKERRTGDAEDAEGAENAEARGQGLLVTAPSSLWLCGGSTPSSLVVHTDGARASVQGLPLPTEHHVEDARQVADGAAISMAAGPRAVQPEGIHAYAAGAEHVRVIAIAYM